MAKELEGNQGREGAVSIIGPGMRIVGDCQAEGTLRIEGSIEGTVRATKAVVVGKDGTIKGDLFTQDAIVGGTITGTVVAESRLELQSTCAIEGEIRARRVKLDEGGRVKGSIEVGEGVATSAAKESGPSSSGRPASSSPPTPSPSSSSSSPMKPQVAR